MRTITIIVLLIALIFVFSNIDRVFGFFGYQTRCPHAVEGNPNASVVISYFEASYCVTCWFEKPVLEKVVKEHGDKFMLQRFDADGCNALMRQNGLVGVPGWVFNRSGNSTKRMGFVSEEELVAIVTKSNS
jgi:thiol:disulfide interchange protein